MQDPSPVEFPTIRPPAPFPEQEQLKCPRCESANTKFCYYNNYNLSQPRYFCKDCRRYWTKGGTLRNIPIGGGTRKNSSSATTKRSSNPKRPNPDPTPDSPRATRRVSEPPPSPPSSSSTPASDTFSASGQQYRLLTTETEPGQNPTKVYGLEADQGRKFSGVGGPGGSFGSLLTANSQFGGIFEGLSTSGSDLKTGQVGLSMGSGGEMGLDLELRERDGGGGEGDGGGYLQGGEWGNGGNNGWPDLAIYTPGSNFH